MTLSVSRAAALLVLTLSSLAVAQAKTPARSTTPPLAGSPPVQRELDVTHADGGYYVNPAGAAAELVPPRLAQPSPAVYPTELEGTGTAGTVELELLIDEHGEVPEAKVVSGVDPRLDAAALDAARDLRFEPATVDGVPLATRMRFSYQFTAPAAPPPPTAELKGLVRARGTRRPLPGATLTFTVAPVPDGGAPTEAAQAIAVETDATGHFAFAVPPGALSIEVSAPGHKPKRFPETLAARQTLEVLYALDPVKVNPYETFVRGEKERTEVSRVTLRNEELREVPGTFGDPFRVVMLMPGVGSVMSGVSYPVVRGSMPASTGYFLDGVRVPSLYHLAVGPAVIAPDFIESIDFYPGPAPVEYGRLMGGAVDGTISRPRDDRLHATAYVDLINAGGFVETPIPATGTSITLAGRISYTPWIIANLARAVVPGQNVKPVADFWDYQGRIEQKIGDGRLRLFAFGSSDIVGTESEEAHVPSVHLVSRFHRFDLRYRQPVLGGEGEVGVTYGLQTLGIEGEQDGRTSGSFLLNERNVEARASWKRELLPNLELRAGVDVDHRRSGIDTRQPDLTDPDGAEQVFRQPLVLTTYSGVYAQVVWKPLPTLSIIPGLRADLYHLVPGYDFPAIDPRLTVRWSVLDRLTVKAGVGAVHQPPTVLFNLPVFEASSLRYGLQSGLQTDVGAEWRPIDGFEVNVDAYYNPIFRAVELPLLDVLANTYRFKIPHYDPGKFGQAYGLELMLRHPIGDNWFAWISYAFQRSTRRTTFSRFDDQLKAIDTVTADVPFAFDQSHVLNASLSYKFADGWSVGTVLHFNTGRPQTGEVSQRSARPVEGSDGNPPFWVIDDRDRVERLPSFFRVDLRISKSWIKDDFVIEAYLDVLDASISSEVLSYDYGQNFTIDPSNPTQQLIELVKTPISVPLVVPMLGVKGTY